MVLTDSNIVVYAADADTPQHESSDRVMQAGADGLIPVVLVPQVLLEFFNVITDGRRTPQPLSPSAAWQHIDALRGSYPVLQVRGEALDLLGGPCRRP